MTRTTLAALAAVVVTCIVLSVISPLRMISGDTVPGRVGAATLRCGHTFDLDIVDWVHRETYRKRQFYFLQVDQLDERTSIFGPGPAVAGAIGLLDFGNGDQIRDDELRTRERYVAAALVAIAALLLSIAVLAESSLPRAIGAGAIAAGSFAGAASLGQGLWQATIALPFLVAGLATLAWSARHPRWLVATPAMLLMAVMLRPVIAPLCLALGVAWALSTRTWKVRVIGAVAALLVASPLALWNLHHLASLFPIGQFDANSRFVTEVYRLSPLGVVEGLGGLLVSPGRGLLWFAPIALLGLWYGFRATDRLRRIVAIGASVQILALATFYKWHGGMAFGPRLLAEVSWVLVWLCLGTDDATRTRRRRAIFWCAVAVTIFVGQLGLWRYRAEQWEARRLPDDHEDALWDVVDSPIAAAFSSVDAQTQFDSPSNGGLRCVDGHLYSLPAPR